MFHDEIPIEPCPWCGKEAEVYSDGSYVDGWFSHVECCDFYCNARGPLKMTGTMSNDEYKNRDEAIISWNEVVGSQAG